MATLFLRSLVCDEPLTSFGDDIEVFVDGTSFGGQFGIDQGQSKDLAQLALAVDPELLSFDDGDTVTIEFKEDSDQCEVNDQPGLQIDVPAAWTPDDKKTHMVNINLIKGDNRDGRYRLFYKFRQV
jgi:hypothetical protein